METTSRARVFIAYSAADVAWVRRLRWLLARLQLPSDELEVSEGVDRVALARARVALLLMSPEVAAWSELPALLDEHRGLSLIVLMARRSDPAGGPLLSRGAQLVAGRPLAAMSGIEARRALLEVLLLIASIMPSPTPGEFFKYMPLHGGRFLSWDPPEPVHLGASAPRTVKPGQEFTARFAAYHPRFVREVRRQLRASGLLEHVSLGKACWKTGTEVTVQLSGDGLEVAPPSQSFTWGGEQHVLDFDVRAGDRGVRYDTRLRFDVSIEGIVLVRLRVDLTVAEPWWRRGRVASTHAIAPCTAFASYAIEDRPRVLDRVAAVRIAAGMEIFVDCLSLRASERWKDRLAREISQRELFMLFWSEFAAESNWVEWEWRHALERKGLDSIQPHPLDPWPRTPLPPELSSLHMGDPLMAVRESALRTG